MTGRDDGGVAQRGETPTSTAVTGAGPVSGVDQTIRGVEGMQTQASVSSGRRLPVAGQRRGRRRLAGAVGSIEPGYRRPSGAGRGNIVYAGLAPS